MQLDLAGHGLDQLAKLRDLGFLTWDDKGCGADENDEVAFIIDAGDG